jgi:hypothetical protein
LSKTIFVNLQVTFIRISAKENAMKLTRSVKETIFERMQTDAAFTKGFSEEARELFLSGEIKTAVVLLNDLEQCNNPMLPNEEFEPFDIADYLHTSDDMSGYFEACREIDPGDGSLILKAEKTIARAIIRRNLSKS